MSVVYDDGGVDDEDVRARVRAIVARYESVAKPLREALAANRAALHAELAQVSIESFALTVRAFHGTQNGNIKTVSDLAQHSERDLRRIKNIGTLTLQEFKDLLADLGLPLNGTR